MDSSAESQKVHKEPRPTEGSKMSQKEWKNLIEKLKISQDGSIEGQKVNKEPHPPPGSGMSQKGWDDHIEKRKWQFWYMTSLGGRSGRPPTAEKWEEIPDNTIVAICCAPPIVKEDEETRAKWAAEMKNA